MITVDARELGAFADDLMAVAFKAPGEVAAIVAKGAVNIKQDWRAAWSGHPHIRHLPRAIDYDMICTPVSASAEIGPRQDSIQGPLAPFIEDGAAGRAAPIPGGRPAADREAPKFEAALAALTTRLLGAQ